METPVDAKQVENLIWASIPSAKATVSDGEGKV